MHHNKTVLQDSLNELAGYLIRIDINLEEDEFLPIFEIIFPANWLMVEHSDYIVEKIPLSQNATRYKVSLRNKKLGADSILSHIIKLISYNEEIEEKQRELHELQKRREAELLLEIEKIKNSFLSEEVSTPTKTKTTLHDETIEKFLEGMNKKKHSSPVQLIDSFVPEKEEDEDGENMEETI